VQGGTEFVGMCVHPECMWPSSLERVCPVLRNMSFLGYVQVNGVMAGVVYLGRLGVMFEACVHLLEACVLAVWRVRIAVHALPRIFIPLQACIPLFERARVCPSARDSLTSGCKADSSSFRLSGMHGLVGSCRAISAMDPQRCCPLIGR
jgi:hypothetical protein